MIEVGQVLSGVYPSFYTEGDIGKDKEIRSKLRRRQRLAPWEKSPVEAVVEWIHPQNRFAVIRYSFGQMSFRECVSLWTREGALYADTL